MRKVEKNQASEGVVRVEEGSGWGRWSKRKAPVGHSGGGGKKKKCTLGNVGKNQGSEGAVLAEEASDGSGTVV